MTRPAREVLDVIDLAVILTLMRVQLDANPLASRKLCFPHESNSPRFSTHLASIAYVPECWHPFGQMRQTSFELLKQGKG